MLLILSMQAFVCINTDRNVQFRSYTLYFHIMVVGNIVQFLFVATNYSLIKLPVAE